MFFWCFGVFTRSLAKGASVASVERKRVICAREFVCVRLLNCLSQNICLFYCYGQITAYAAVRKHEKSRTRSYICYNYL